MIILRNQVLLIIQKKALEKVKEATITIAETEGLTAHANSIRVRFNDKNF